MPFSDAAMAVGANAIRTACAGMQLHTGNPGVGGAANKSAAPMQVPSWTVVTADGDFGLASALTFSGATPNGAITYVSLWSNTSGSGIWYGNFPLSGDLTADSAGGYTVEELTINGSST